MKIRFSLAVAVVLVWMSVSGLAQQSNTFQVKPTQEKAPKMSAPIGKTAAPVTASTANAQALKSVEHQGMKGSAASRSAGTKTAPALKPVKDKPNPSMNFKGSSRGKGTGLATQAANPYEGRLKQKGSGNGRQ